VKAAVRSLRRRGGQRPHTTYLGGAVTHITALCKRESNISAASDLMGSCAIPFVLRSTSITRANPRRPGSTASRLLLSVVPKCSRRALSTTGQATDVETTRGSKTAVDAVTT
jgi:hypothetical protein